MPLTFTFEYAGTGPALTRSAILEYPFDWDVEDHLRDPNNVATFPGHSVVLALGGGTGAEFRADLDLVPDNVNRAGAQAALAQAFVLYPDPVTFGGTNYKWNSGQTGEESSLIDPDDVGFLLELLHQVRTFFQDRLTARYNAQVAAGVVVNPIAYEVFDPARIYIIGWSAGASMGYRLAYEAPLVHPSASSYLYKFARMFVSAGTVGGFRRGQDEVDGFTRVDYSPGSTGIPAGTVTRRNPTIAIDAAIKIMHVQGAEDPRVAAQWIVFAPPSVITQAAAYKDDNTAAGGSAKVVVSRAKAIDNYVTQGGYSVTDALRYARWDYTVEYGLERWMVYKGLFLWAASPIIAPATTNGTWEELGVAFSGATGAEAANYNLGPRALLQYGPAGDDIVLMIVQNMNHQWPTAYFDISRMAKDYILDLYP
jgi:poly(3-hydroxybutyrate) depolymerase